MISADLGVGRVAVKDHVPGVVGERHVVLGQRGLAAVEARLVAEGVRAVAKHAGSVHYGAAGETVSLII